MHNRMAKRACNLGKVLVGLHKFPDQTNTSHVFLNEPHMIVFFVAMVTISSDELFARLQPDDCKIILADITNTRIRTRPYPNINKKFFDLANDKHTGNLAGSRI